MAVAGPSSSRRGTSQNHPRGNASIISLAAAASCSTQLLAQQQPGVGYSVAPPAAPRPTGVPFVPPLVLPLPLVRFRLLGAAAAAVTVSDGGKGDRGACPQSPRCCCACRAGQPPASDPAERGIPRAVRDEAVVLLAGTSEAVEVAAVAAVQQQQQQRQEHSTATACAACTISAEANRRGDSSSGWVIACTWEGGESGGTTKYFLFQPGRSRVQLCTGASAALLAPRYGTTQSEPKLPPPRHRQQATKPGRRFLHSRVRRLHISTASLFLLSEFLLFSPPADERLSSDATERAIT